MLDKIFVITKFLSSIRFEFRETSGGYIHVEEHKSWIAAKKHCLSLNTRLMEIRTQEDFDRAKRIKSEIGSDFYVGGSDRKVEGEWLWESNGELIDINRFWRRWEPNDNGGQDCLYMRSGGFDDWKCDEDQAFVCDFY